MPAPRLTLRTLLAYIDDTLEPDEARALGKKVAESEEAQKIIERIRRITRRRGLTTPVSTSADDMASDANTVAEYLSDNLNPEEVGALEDACLESDLHLAELAACHQILTLLLTDPVRVPPTANQRMYKLVGAPASDPDRKPGKSLPIGGTAPTAPEQADADDADAALLLGMNRYTDPNSRSGRFGLVAAVGCVAVCLALAVFMALPHSQQTAPDTTHVASIPAPVTVPIPTPPKVVTPSVEPKPIETKKPIEPDPKDTKEPKEPKLPDPKEVKKEPTVDPKEPKMPDPKVGGPKPDDLAPLPGVEVVGKIDTPNVIVLTRAPQAVAKWSRIEPTARSTVRANDYVMALPGYHADIKLDSGVAVYLWGNLPQQVAMKQMVMETRVRFHPAAGGLDADLTLDGGRIYLTTTKPAGAKIRLRVGLEVWDVKLRDEKSEVMLHVSNAYIPGTPYARTGGEKPRTEAKLVVLRGTADFHAPTRFSKHEALAAWTEITWDSKTGQLSAPHPAQKEELFASRIPNIEGEFGKAIQRVLGDAVKGMQDPDTVRVLLKERLVLDPTDKLRPNLSEAEIVQLLFPTQWAAYAQAAIMDNDETPELLKDLFDLLRNETRSYARQAAVVALSNWIGRSPENTELLVKGMIEKGWLPEPADQFAQLLRGYSSADMKDKNAALAGLEKLVELLDDQHLIIREAALGNLLAYYAGPDTFQNPILVQTSVADREVNRAGAVPAKLKAWEAFLKAWSTHAEVIKKRIMEKK